MSFRRPACWATGIMWLALVVAPVVAEPVIAGKVVGIQDGDTLTLLDSSDDQHRIRLAGIDAPEKSQPYGQVAKENLSAMAYSEYATADCPKLDKYGRLVCIVRVGGGDLGLAQIASGLAWHYKKYAHEQLPENRATYAEAEVVARSAGLGLWKDAEPIAPWEFRRKRGPGTGDAPQPRSLPRP